MATLTARYRFKVKPDQTLEGWIDRDTLPKDFPRVRHQHAKNLLKLHQKLTRAVNKVAGDNEVVLYDVLNPPAEEVKAVVKLELVDDVNVGPNYYVRAVFKGCIGIDTTVDSALNYLADAVVRRCGEDGITAQDYHFVKSISERC